MQFFFLNDYFSARIRWLITFVDPRNISADKNARVSFDLQIFVDLDEALAVERFAHLGLHVAGVWEEADASVNDARLDLFTRRRLDVA